MNACKQIIDKGEIVSHGQWTDKDYYKYIYSNGYLKFHLPMVKYI